jgi:hypothetical protein
MRRVWAVLLGTSALLAVAETASALPAFARRYGVACHFCHDGFPKLNNNGQRFKERGFRMPQEEAFDAAAWIRSVPLDARLQLRRTILGETEEGNDLDDISTFFGKGISAGSLGSRFSYWIDDGVFWNISAEEEDDEVQHTEVDNGWGRIEIVKNGKFYLKGGRFELDLPFTQARTPNLFAYDIYSTNAGFEQDNIGSFQQGAEVGGTLTNGFHWSAAVVDGHNGEDMEAFDDEVGKFDANVFLRAAKRFERHRVGAFAYFGNSTLARSPSIVWEDGLLRVGADADLRFGQLNLYGVFMYGRNDNPVALPSQPDGTNESFDWTGGFAQGDFNVADSLQLTLRVNAVSRPTSFIDASSKETFTSIWPGIRFFILERIKLAFEYGFHNQDQVNLGAVQAEVAF